VDQDEICTRFLSLQEIYFSYINYQPNKICIPYPNQTGVLEVGTQNVITTPKVHLFKEQFVVAEGFEPTYCETNTNICYSRPVLQTGFVKLPFVVCLRVERKPKLFQSLAQTLTPAHQFKTKNP